MRITRIKFKSFLVSLLGVLTAEVDFSNGQQPSVSLDHRHCYNITGEEICYCLVSNGESNWKTAHEKCQNRNSSSLPIIRNIDEQRALEEYLKRLNALTTNAVWMSGKRKIYNNWTWINNNQTLNTTVKIYSGSNPADKTHMAIYKNAGAENRLKTINPAHPAWFLCQYKGHQCNGQYENATNGCLIPSENDLSWYEARNECLLNGGDLPVFTDQDQEILKIHKFPKEQYWIGLRKADWVWITSNISKASPKEEEEEEVKYNKWARQAMPTERDSCITILANDGQWRASNCNNAIRSVVCEKRGNTHPSTRISFTSRGSRKYSTTTQTTAGNFPPTTPTTTTTTITTSMIKHSENFSTLHSVNPVSTRIYSTSINSTSTTSTTAATSDSSNFPSTTPTTKMTPITTSIIKHNEIFSTSHPVPTKIDSTSTKSTTATTAESNVSVIAAVGAALAVIIILCIIIVILVVKCRKSKPSNNKKEPAQTDSETMKDMKTKEKETYKTTEERSIYADIPLTENTANDRVESTPKGTVYASLDFNQGVTYAEPSTGKLYANTQNVSGPIYAEPLDAAGNGTTSAGSSPAVKIGPMGDVYALPTTNVTPSSAKTTERPIYANT